MEQTKAKTVKVGPLTLALALVIGGMVLLVYNFGGLPSLEWLWKLWPLLLVGLGLEYFIRRATAGEANINFHVPSIMLIFVLIPVSAVAIALTGVGEKLDNFINNGLFFGEGRYEHTWSWQAKPLELDTGVELVQVEQKVGLLNMLPSEDGKLHATAEVHARSESSLEGFKERFHPVVNQQNGIVQVKVPLPEERENQVKVDLTVKVPPGIPVEADSSVGKIEARKMDNDIKVVSRLGSVELNNIKGKIEAETHSGKLSIIDPGSEVNARTNLGKIDFIAHQPLDGVYTLKSDVGGVNFQVPEGSNLSVTAKSEVGDIHLSLPSGVVQEFTREGPSRECRFKLGGGKGRAEISVQTGAVDISVR